MKLASHLHCPLQRVKNETTSTEFIMWQEYLEQDLVISKREYYYLAQIAAEIRRTISKHPKRIKLQDFLLKFRNDKKVNNSMLSVEERTKKSKSFWKALVGIK